MVATNNFYQTIGMLMASAVMSVCYTRLHLGADTIFAGFGIAMFLVTAYMLTIVPDFFVRFVLWMLTHTIFRIRIAGRRTCPSAARRCWWPTTCRTSTASWSAPACSASSASWCGSRTTS